jgi:1-aminocyclopropane-1-carboxylate deaminase/D-cysteine desulfhydrase-like pyridoxal-dependent ACC family enzyme
MAKMQITDLNKIINFQLPVYENLNFEENRELVVKRFDVMHATVNGNKWFKLMFNLEEMNRRGAKQLVTFGGAFSNHIYATAAAAKELGIHSVGIIQHSCSQGNAEWSCVLFQEQIMKSDTVKR